MIDLPLEYWLVCAAGAIFAFMFLTPRRDDDAVASGDPTLAAGAKFAMPPPGQIGAYGFDADIRMVALPCASFRDARVLVTERHLASNRRYETGGEAMQATALGFTRSANDDFIEINCVGQDNFEVRAGRDLTGVRREQTVTGSGLTELMRLVEMYFTGTEAFREHWTGLTDRKDFL